MLGKGWGGGGAEASEGSEQTKHWRGKPLFTNNRLPLQCFDNVSSEASRRPGGGGGGGGGVYWRVKWYIGVDAVLSPDTEDPVSIPTIDRYFYPSA